jgi:hypothetical protein
MKGLIKAFGIISGLVGFTADLAAFLQLFGIDVVVVAPSTRIAIFGPQTTSLKLPFNIDFRTIANIEVWTFLIWFYLAMVAIWLSFLAYDESAAFEYFSTLFCAFVAILLAIWLRGFGYVPEEIYVFLVPTLAFIGLAWAASLGSSISVLIFYIAVGPAILWFNIGYEWSLFWIVVITAISFLVGGSVGYSLASHFTQGQE